ncbi:uncharacterized protein LOC105430585 [Pogonomyrmex barbatus]|uniref:Uncharacterized protein LOC105430585 n=1 Tax=Pogonomyrmex barbatus TaxID=144034 RepID=A0A6I9WS50_9HYME|nr:uncharacterized protein LOC105430585 [Pogonomyrmex barbatus]
MVSATRRMERLWRAKFNKLGSLETAIRRRKAVSLLLETHFTFKTVSVDSDIDLASTCKGGTMALHALNVITQRCIDDSSNFSGKGQCGIIKYIRQYGEKKGRKSLTRERKELSIRQTPLSSRKFRLGGGSRRIHRPEEPRVRMLPHKERRRSIRQKGTQCLARSLNANEFHSPTLGVFPREGRIHG